MNGPEHRDSRERPHKDQLPNAVATWATPDAQQGGSTTQSADRKSQTNLKEQAQVWASPKTPTGGKELSKSHRHNAGGIDLQSQVVLWAPANEGDCKSRLRHKGRNPTLNGHIRTFPSSPQPRMTTELGRLLRIWTPPQCPRLNPVFQWLLMGWPSPTRIFSDSGAMEWSRWRRLLLSALCGIERCLQGDV